MVSIMVESAHPATMPVQNASGAGGLSRTAGITSSSSSQQGQIVISSSMTSGFTKVGSSAGPASAGRAPARNSTEVEREERRLARYEVLPRGDARTVASRAFKGELPAMDLIQGIGERLSPQGLKLKPAMWNKDTDLVLRDLVLRQEVVDWNKIATTIEWDTGSISPQECQRRWDAVKETPVKGPWSAEEDEHLKRLVDIYGAKKWNLLAKAFPGRSGKQCRERWHNHVDERVKKGEWTAEEDQILCEAQRQLGNKWSEMSRILHGRSENAIKNRFNSLNAKGLTETRANELLARAGHAASASSLVGHDLSKGGYGSSTGYHSGDPDDMDMDMEPRTGLWRGNGGRQGRGGSSALQALMAAATNERAACERGDFSFGRNHNCPGGDWNSEGVESDDGGEEFYGSRQSPSWREEDGERGDSFGPAGEAGVRRGTKRDRGAGRMEAFGGSGTSGGASRRKRANNPVAGISILAQAAGILELKYEDNGNDYDDSEGISEFGSASLSGASARRGSGDSSKFSAESSRNHRMSGNHNATTHRGSMPFAGPKNNTNGRGMTRTIIDHGSTPPGSASPPPDANTPGGAGVAAGGGEGGAAGAAGAASGGAGGSGARGGGGWNVKRTAGDAFNGRGDSGGINRARKNCNVATAFAVSPGETVAVSNHQGSTSYPMTSRYGGRDTRGSGSYSGYGNGDFSGGGGGSFGGGFGGAGACHSAGGGERGPMYRGSMLGSGAASASPRSGWYVGPDGAYRRGLGSVPGPWRPYWKGEEGFAVGNAEGDVGGIQQQQQLSEKSAPVEIRRGA